MAGYAGASYGASPYGGLRAAPPGPSTVLGGRVTGTESVRPGQAVLGGLQVLSGRVLGDEVVRPGVGVTGTSQRVHMARRVGNTIVRVRPGIRVGDVIVWLAPPL